MFGVSGTEHDRRALQLALAIVMGLCGGCGLAPLSVGAELSLGRASRGFLQGGTSLPNRGEGFGRARAGEGTRYGTKALVGAIERAAGSVSRAFPGAAPLRVGDLSSRRGGKHPRHGSHRTGRDADILFYLLNSDGASTRGRGWLAFGSEGYSVERDRGEAVPGEGSGFFFDTARNWHFVRTLLLDPEAEVQWIFCGADVKARLLSYGAVHEPDPSVLVRAASVVHQPSYGNPHTDHFHVRLACTGVQRARGCRDVGPSWPWSRLAHEKAVRPGSETDALLLRELLGEPTGGGVGEPPAAPASPSLGSASGK